MAARRSRQRDKATHTPLVLRQERRQQFFVVPKDTIRCLAPELGPVGVAIYVMVLEVIQSAQADTVTIPLEDIACILGVSLDVAEGVFVRLEQLGLLAAWTQR